MRKNLLSKKMKFATLLSITAVLGIQVVHAGEVKCPTQLVQHESKRLAFGTTTGARTIEMMAATGRLRNYRFTRVQKVSPPYGISCHYMGNNGEFEFGLTNIYMDKFLNCEVFDGEGKKVNEDEFGTTIMCDELKGKVKGK